MNKLMAVVAAAALLATACGGSSNDGAATTAPGETAAGSEIANSTQRDPLAFLGDLVTSEATSTVERIDDVGGVIELGDGSAIVASPGAFANPTEVTASVADVDLGDFFDAPPFAKAYVVSTVEDIDLPAPVTIEIDRPADGLRAVQRIDGEFVNAEVIDNGATSAVAIPHFSEVMTLVVEAFNEERSVDIARERQAAADAEFFEACFVAVSGIYGASVIPGDEDFSADIEFAHNMAISICTTALVRRATPSGVSVSTACVGDRISDDVNLREAISRCAAQETDETAGTSNPSDEDPEGDTQSTPEDTPPTPVIDGTYRGENGYVWAYSDMEVLNDQIEIEISGGQIITTVFDRDWFKYINKSSAAADYVEGAQCEYYAHVEWQNTGPQTSEVVIDEETGVASVVLHQPGQLNHWIEFPDCLRDDVPVKRQDDGTDDVEPLVGSLSVRQSGPDLVIWFAHGDGWTAYEKTLIAD